MLLEPRDTFEALRRDFRWDIPADFNIGRVVSDDWAAKAPERICLQHFSPDGDHLESIGYEIQKQTQEEKATQLQEQIVLLQSLCEKITQEVELPAQAISGLGDLVFRVRGLWRGRVYKNKAAYWPPYFN